MSVELVIKAFMAPHRRRRYLELLQTDRGRKKLRLRLAHCRDFDERFVVPLERRQRKAADIARALFALGAPKTCSVFGASESDDAVDVPLLLALEAVESGGSPAIVSCDPGRLAYFRDEEPSEGFILRRP